MLENDLLMTISGSTSNKSSLNHEFYPKVLIVGESFHTSSGGGITQSNLFKSWPKDKIAIIPYENGTSDPSICSRIYNLSQNENKYFFPFGVINKISRKFEKTPNKIPISSLNQRSNQRDKSLIKTHTEGYYQKHRTDSNLKTGTNIFGFLRGKYRKLTGFFGIDHIKSRLVVSSELLRWIDEFDPDVIYAQFATLDKIRFLYNLKTLRDIPLVLHFMDDWPSVLVSPGLFHKYWDRTINMELRRLIDSAGACIAISEKMSSEYKIRYNKDFTFIHNPVDIDKWLPFSKTSWEVGSTFKILYAGRIGGSIIKSTNTIAEIVQDLSMNNYSIEFHIYTKDFNNTALAFKNMPAVHVHEPIPDYNQLPKLFSSHDLLLIPLEFDSRFLRLSMPTKVSEYMISGTPVMVFAPHDTALAEYALEYQWAYIIENDKQSIRNSVLDLLHNESTRRDLGLRAKELAIKRHDANIIRSDFRHLLTFQSKKY